MILEFLLNLFSGFFGFFLGLFADVVTLPTDLMAVLGNITGFGAYIIGSDLLMLLAGSVTFWTATKLSAGVAIWLWRLLPFT